MPRPRVRVPLSPPNAPVAQRIERRRPKSRVGGSNPSRGTIKIHGRRRFLLARSVARIGAAQIGATHRRSVAQPGQSAGLQNQWPGVRILPLLPILGTKKAPHYRLGPFVLGTRNYLLLAVKPKSAFPCIFAAVGIRPVNGDIRRKILRFLRLIQIPQCHL